MRVPVLCYSHLARFSLPLLSLGFFGRGLPGQSVSFGRLFRRRRHPTGHQAMRDRSRGEIADFIVVGICS